MILLDQAEQREDWVKPDVLAEDLQVLILF